MTRKPGFDPDAHRAIGAELKRICRALGEVQAFVYRAYPVNGPESSAAQSAMRAVDKLRSRLDGALFREGHGPPFHGEDLTQVYYGTAARDRVFPDDLVPSATMRKAREARKQRRAALDELTAQSQDAGLYD